MRGYNAYKDPEIIGSGQQIIVAVSVSQEEFYALLAETIRHNQFQQTECFLIWKREGLFKPKFKYLRVKYRGIYFDILALHQQYNFCVLWRVFKEPNRTMQFISAMPNTENLVKSFQGSRNSESEMISVFQQNIRMCIEATVNQVRTIKINRNR